MAVPLFYRMDFLASDLELPCTASATSYDGVYLVIDYIPDGTLEEIYQTGSLKSNQPSLNTDYKICSNSIEEAGPDGYVHW